MTQAGPAIPVTPVTDRYADASPALRVAVVSDGRPIAGGPARPVIVVTDGRPTQGNEPVPVVLATGAQAGHVLAGPAIPVVLVSGSLNPPIGTLVDNFDDNSQSMALWSKTNVYFFNAGVTVAETSGQLQITPRTSAAGSNYGGYQSVNRYDMTGGAISVRAVQVATGTSTDTEMVAALDINNFFDIYKENNTIFFAKNVAGVLTTVASAAYSAVTHAWWRIRHVVSDDTIRFDTSTDGLAWTQRASTPRPFAIDSMLVQLDAGTFGSVASPGMAIFDNFNTLP